MKNIFKNIAIVIGLSAILFSGCKDDIAPIIEELDFNRVFAPTEVTVRIRNMTTAELSWEVRPDAASYIVEFSEDSLEFNNIVASETVMPDEIPFSYRLAGETLYSARIKGVSNKGIEDSKWTEIVFRTDAENILYPLEDGDVQAKSAIIKWPAGEEATHFVINPGNINRPITAEEIAAGEATITDLTGETEYNVKMLENDKQRGELTFTTLVDLEGVIQVRPEDDLNAIITEAEDGAELILYPGEYTVFQGDIVINKSISIKGLYPYDKPKINIQFLIETGAGDISVADIEMIGEYVEENGGEEILSYAFKFNSSGNAEHGNLSIQGCVIHGYEKSLLAGSSNVFSVESVMVDDCIVSDVLNDGGDFIDFRNSYVAKLTVTNSTFYNVATEYTRDFIRMDGSTKGNTYDDGTRTPEIVVTNCTMNNVMNSGSTMKRYFYVRWSQHTIESENNLFTDMGISVYTNQSLTLQPQCSLNNYFNADGYFTEAEQIKIDNSDNYTTVDPGFADPANGDFTVSNQTILDNNVGDPRWLNN